MTHMKRPVSLTPDQHAQPLLLFLLLTLAVSAANAAPPADGSSRIEAAANLQPYIASVQNELLAEEQRNSAIKAIAEVESLQATVALNELLCSLKNTPRSIRNSLELAVVERATEALPLLLPMLDEGRCDSGAVAVVVARVARRLPDGLPDLCASYGSEATFSVALGIASSGHPHTLDLLTSCLGRAGAMSNRCSVCNAACSVSQLCTPILLDAFTKPLDVAELSCLLAAMKDGKATGATPALRTYLDSADPLTLLSILETLEHVGPSRLEKEIFTLLTTAPPPLWDQLLVLLSKGDPEVSRPLLQQHFASHPPSTGEQRRVARWLMADAPDILYRGNASQTTPVHAQATTAQRSFCRLTLRTAEGIKVAVDGQLRLVCGSSDSRTTSVQHERFDEDGTLEFPCLCNDGTRPQTSWITTDGTVVEAVWP